MLRLKLYSHSVGDEWKIQRKASARRIGVEIELGFPTQAHLTGFFSTATARNLDKYCIAKSDSSIRAAFCAEMVIRPLVFLEAKRVAKRVIEAALEHDVNLRGCGVHVHVTRDAWPKAALLYARFAIMGQSRAVSAYWNALATRSENTYCSRYAVVPDAVWSVSDAWHDWTSRHFDAVSRSNHEPTIEFRLFGPTRQARTLASYLDAVQALLEYAVEQTRHTRESERCDWVPFNPQDFAAWVATQPGFQALKWRHAHSRQVRRALQALAPSAPASPQAQAAEA